MATMHHLLNKIMKYQDNQVASNVAGWEIVGNIGNGCSGGLLKK